jgi:phage terminase large subunit-like protein
LLKYRPNNPKMLRMHKSDAKTRMLLGGKRSGKSTFSIVEVCWAALGIHPYLKYPEPPLKIRMCAVDFNSGIKGVILPELRRWLPKSAEKRYWAEDRIFELVNGTLIDMKSYEMDIEKFEGVERHLVSMDETPPKDVYQSNYMRTISAGINGKLIISCTPLHGMDWLFFDLYDNPLAKPPYVEYAHVRTDENPHLNIDAIDNVRHDPAMQDCMDAALYGEFIPKSGLVWPDFSDKKHIIDPIPVSKLKDMMVMVGIDPHDRNPHGVIFMAMDKDGRRYIFDEILEKCIISELADRIKSKLGVLFPPRITVMDTSGNVVQSTSGVSVKTELDRRGIYITSATKEFTAGRLKVASLLNPGIGKEPDLYITRNCLNTIREFKHYSWDDWVRKRNRADPKEQPIKKDDHLVDSTRYLCMLDVVYRPPGFAHKPDIWDTPHNKVTGYRLGR